MRTALRISWLACLVALASPALAQPKAGSAAPAAPAANTITGTVKVTETNGTAVTAPVVVYVVSANNAAAANGASISHTVKQEGKKFTPDLIAITVGDKVAFPNGDKLLHNVFSPKPKFDMGTLKHGEGKEPQDVFKSTGVVDVYCNIHPEMAATILVLPNRYHTTSKDGSFKLAIPDGDWTLFAYTRRAQKPVSVKIKVSGGQTLTQNLSIVRGPEAPHADKFGGKYSSGGYR